MIPSDGQPSWGPTPKRFQPLWVALGVLCLPPGLAASYLGVLPPTEDIPAMAASFIPFGLVAYVLAFTFLTIALVRARRRLVLALLLGATTLLLALQVSWLVPFVVPDNRPADTEPITVMSLNLYHGKADAAQVMERARTADIVMLLEYTPEAEAALRDLGLDEVFAYSAGASDTGVVGSAIYSRFPLTHEQQVPQSEFQQWMATAEVPTLGQVRLVAAHPCNPVCGDGLWNTEHQQLRQLAKPYLDQNMIMAGDFNATSDHLPMRQLVRDGMKSAADITGAGWMPTYPTDWPLPPVIGIDHIMLTPTLTATSIESFGIDGTDHRGLIAEIAGSR